MKLRDQVLDEVARMPSDRIAVVHDLIHKLLPSPKATRRAGARSSAHVRVRRALARCKGSLSADVSALRQDRV